MHENNQYGYAMTKPLWYGCMEKQVKIPTIRKFNIILNNISHEEKVGHLFLVDIKFHEMNEKTILFNEYIYTAVWKTKTNKTIWKVGPSAFKCNV